MGILDRWNWKNIVTKPLETIKGSLETPGGLLGQDSVTNPTKLQEQYTPNSNLPSINQPTGNPTTPEGAGTYNYDYSGTSGGNSNTQNQVNVLEDITNRRNELAQKERQSTLDSIARRIGNLGSTFEQNKQLAENERTKSGEIAQRTATNSLTAIDEALAQALPTLEKNKSDVIDTSEQNINKVAEQLRQQFAGRNALDSTFFAKALGESTASLAKQKTDQLFNINQSISDAKLQATQQKRSISIELQNQIENLDLKKQQYLSQLEQEYNNGMLSLKDLQDAANLQYENFATENEINKIGQLAQLSYNLDSYISDLSDRQTTTTNAINSLSSTGSNYTPDTSSSNALLNQFATALSNTQATGSSTSPYLMSSSKKSDDELSALEKALGYSTASNNNTSNISSYVNQLLGI